MTNTNDARRAHELLDELDARAELSQEQEKLLRSFLPELPKQKTLEEIHEYVDDAWLEADDPELKEWLHELHFQLKGLEVAATIAPALPAGMRLADHEEYGRVVVSTVKDVVGCYAAFRLGNWNFSGVADHYVSPDALTFIDSEPAKPTHPEFLETEADYQKAPRGTVAAKDGWKAWLKEADGVWSCGGGSDGESSLAQTGKRRVLRWGWGE